jgi:tRNA uridine 5-carbamoylmethylation protein Kti12
MDYDIELNDEQKDVLDQIIKRIKGSFIFEPQSKYNNEFVNNLDPFVIRISGYAGTGKTTLLAQLKKEIYKTWKYKLNVALMAYTGKAASVLKTKLDESRVNILEDDYVGTIHSFLYRPETKWDRLLKSYVVIGWKLKHRSEMHHHIIIIPKLIWK